MADFEKVFAVFLPEIYREYVLQLRSGLDEEAKKQGVRLIYFSTFSDNASFDMFEESNKDYDDGERTTFRMLDFNNVDAVIILFDTFADAHWEEIFDMLDNQVHCPVISFRSRYQGAYNILVDDDTSFAAMVQHMIDVHDARKIYLITGPASNSHSLVREEIYKKTLEANKLQYQEYYIYYGNFWKNCGEPALASFLNADKELPDTIICANDYMAISVIHALESRGIKVPDQVRVTGYDNLNDGIFHYPSLTSLAQPVVEMGRTAIDIGVRLFNGEEVPRDTLLPSTMHFRQSCGCEDLSVNHTLSYPSVLLDQLDRVAYQATTTSLMVTFTSSAKSLEECLQYIEKYCTMDTGFGDFALCLASGWESQLPVPDRAYFQSSSPMHMAFGIYNEQKLPETIFPVKQMMPEPFLSDPKPYYIFPLHYMQYYMGYVIVSIKENSPSWANIKSWFLNLENTLENERIRAKLNTVVKELEHLYDKDTLTGLYNRRGLERFGNKYYNECLRNQSKFIIMEIDMDGLKLVNDQYGHAEGDVCIAMISNALVFAAKNGEICVRSGGDEYIVIGKDYSESRLKNFLNDFEQYLKDANETMNKPYHFAASMGYCMAVPDGRNTTEDYMKLADHDMYKNKKQRKAASHPGVEVR